MTPADPVELVRHYLRAQNLEQLGRLDDALEHYEAAVSGGFDSTGPYDRLIAIYTDQARYADVVRVAEAALDGVRTYPAKRSSYERVRDAAREAAEDVPQAAPKKSR